MAGEGGKVEREGREKEVVRAGAERGKGEEGRGIESVRESVLGFVGERQLVGVEGVWVGVRTAC